MKTGLMIALLAGLAALPARAQPAPPGCGTSGPGIPLQLNLGSLPGAAGRQAQGQALVEVPSAAANPCPSRPHLPRDVLHGDPGDALAGPPGEDPLTGRPRTR